MITLGIDTGLTGGWAALDGSELVAWGRTPTMMLGKKRIVDALQFHCDLPDRRVYQCGIEWNGAMPAQGRSSCFTFGHATGSVYGVIVATKCASVDWVRPQAWKKHFGLNRDKRDSLKLASKRFDGGPDWTVLANDGIAEAALIALYLIEKGEADHG